MTLPEAFTAKPIAHRGLHDAASGVIENSPTAFTRAIEHGFGIELDLQLSSDGHAMVFHDYALNRLTEKPGPVRQNARAELVRTALTGSNDTIHDLHDILALVDGRVPLLIELKDQDGAMGPNIGPLEEATAECLKGYKGAVAVMSFNPHAVARMAELLPDVPRGLVTSAYDAKNWPLPEAVRNALRDIPDYDRIGASFVSHEAGDLKRPRVNALKSAGATILCWTIRSQAAADQALQIADNITFEGYLPS